MSRVTLTGGGTLTDQTSFESGTDGWVAGNPASENPAPVAPWTVRRAIGFRGAVGVATRRTQYWGFGLEGVSDAQTRTALIGDVRRYLGVDPRRLRQPVSGARHAGGGVRRSAPPPHRALARAGFLLQ